MAKKLEILSVESESAITENKNTKSVIDFELNAEIVAGTLTSNAKELKTAIEEKLTEYTVDKYINEPDAAKTDKAFLNKIKESVASKRKEISNAWNKPLDEFLTEMKTLEKSISDASDKINEIVKEADNKEKEEKRKQIESYWSTLDFTIVSLDKIFNPKWLNKTYKLNQIMLDCEQIIEKITTEFATLKSMKDEDSEILMNFYLDTLDLNATLQKGNQLKANRERIKAIEAQKIAAQNTLKAESVTNTVNIPAEKNKIEVKQETNNSNDPVMEYKLILHGKKSSLFKIKEYMIQLGISFTKI